VDNVKVSIITPCYNSEKTIRRTIESVLNQTYQNIEYIIIDGKSTDHTVDIIKEYAGMGNIKYVSEKDKGIYSAMNKGISMTSGKIIGIINSDDFYEADAVQKVVAHMSDFPYQVIYGYCNSWRGNRCRKIKVNHKELEERMIPHPTCFVTRKTYCKYAMFSEWLKIAADYEIMLRFYETRNVRFIQIPDVLANFSEGGISMKKGKSSLLKKENLIIQYKYKIISTKELLENLLEIFLNSKIKMMEID